jgi:hypothetical protein
LFGSLFGGGGGGAVELAGEGVLKSLTATAGVFHSGGMVGGPGQPSRFVPVESFAGAPRYHNGGMVGLPGLIGPDERPVIAQTGERILSRQETAAYNRGGGGGGAHFHFHGVKAANAFRNTESQLSAFAARAMGRSGRNR